LILFVPGAR